MRVESLPFTVYDILGYLIPGILAEWIIISYLGTHGLMPKVGNIIPIAGFEYKSIATTLIFFVLAYTIGYIVSFTSTSIENLSTYYYGYPGEYIFPNTETKNKLFPTIRIIKVFLAPITIAIKIIKYTDKSYGTNIRDDMICKKLPSNITDAAIKRYKYNQENKKRRQQRFL